MWELILKYFPALSQQQQIQFKAMLGLYGDWNSKINVISRKDIDALYEKHVLHSLAIAEFMQFVPGTKVLDIGTGGGFPGIPLAVLFPEVHFTLCDSVKKKIKVVEEVALGLGLHNITCETGRAEELRQHFHFVVSRAVAPMADLYTWAWQKLEEDSFNSKINGFLLLKGGDLREEIAELKLKNRKLNVQLFDLNKWFDEPFFETKKLVYIF